MTAYPRKIVLYGATGYTGGLTARAMVASSSRPVLAGRHQGRLTALAEQLSQAGDGISWRRRSPDPKHPDRCGS